MGPLCDFRFDEHVNGLITRTCHPRQIRNSLSICPKQIRDGFFVAQMTES